MLSRLDGLALRMLVTHGITCACFLSSAAGQTSTWLSVDGNWSDLANWDRANVPNTCGEQAILGGATAYRVNVDGQWSVGEVRIDNALAQVRIANNQFLRICGFDGATTRNGLTNNGTITVNTTAGPNATYISFDDNTPLAGTGAIVLNCASNDSNSAYLQTGNTSIETLLNATQTIRGAGRIYGRYQLSGLIRADVGDGRPLALWDAPFRATGTGRIEVADGALLQLVGNTPMTSVPISSQGTGAVALFRSGNNNPSLTTMTISAPVRLADNTDIGTNNLTINGPLTLVNNSRLYVNGDVGLTVNGSVVINTTAGASTSTYIRLDQSGRLSGNADIRLNCSIADLNTAQLYQLNTSIVTTIDPTVTIRGAGWFSGSGRYNLGGVIRADQTDRRLGLYEANFFGSGNARVEVNSDCTLRIQGADLTDVPIVGQARSKVEFADQSTNPILTRVTATTFGEQLNGSTYMEDCTWNGTYRIANNSILRIRGVNGLTCNGEIVVNTTGGPNSTFINLEQTCPIRGNATISLNASINDNSTAYIQCANSGIAGTIDSGVLIRGTGRIYGTYSLAGVIRADVPNLYLFLWDGTTTGTSPNARVEIRSGAFMRIQGAYLNDAAIVGQPNATLEFANQSREPALARVNISTPRTDILNGVSNFTDCTSSSNIRIANNAGLRVGGANGLVNNGDILVNPTAGTSGTYVILNESCTIGGNGTITLNAFTGNFDTAYIQLAADNLTGTLGAQQTLRGTGNVYRRWVNRGKVAPGRPDQPNTIGQINIVNGYSWTQADSATMEMEVGGTQAGQFDRVTGGGGSASIVLNGVLNLRLVPGFQPNQGDTFAIIQGGSITGRFASVNYPPGYTGSIVYPTQTGQPVTVSFRRVQCVADFDDGSGTGTRDGGVTIDDLLYYLGLFSDGNVAADVDDGTGTNTPDGGVTIDDLLYYLQRFEAGC